MNKEELLKGGLDDIYRKYYFDLKDRIDKALEYIENRVAVYGFNNKGCQHWEFYDNDIFKLLHILKGEEQ